ncbi:HNH endonuclease signature motif containing protein [Modestobacter sp. Leaf380]|uniref:HNH endonuclease signature motif containing protein n=1 Tax=Modestobacter sp. Leaf380 TaxID=1736356 RepID=UPI0006F3711E|nr:HNH endonuclease signature motif containing protein [Modestobacter sp. Leaf380]KQS73644.1 endonuclease [Modestobacter sp. Leaf380]
MSELRSAVVALAADDLHALRDGQLLDSTSELARTINRLQAELVRTVRHADVVGAAEHDGLRTMQSVLRGHHHFPPGAAAAVVRAGRVLEHLPRFESAFAEGAVTAAQVGVVAAALRPCDIAAAEEQGVDLHAFDEAWTEVARTLPHAKLGTAVQAFRHALDPDGPEPDPTERRRLTITRHDDGSGSGRFDLDAVGPEKVAAVIESMVQADRPQGDTRNRAQQQGDALVQWADNTLAAGSLPFLRTVKPHVVVTVDLADLVDPSTGHDTSTTGFGARLSAARARWVACDSAVTRIVMGPEGLPLDVGRTKRVVPPHIRRAVEQRDGHCVFAGCSAPTHWCDVHHLAEWVLDQGDTSLDNSALLCERHHTKVHHGFRVERDDGAPPGQRWRTTRPDGSAIVLGSSPA